MSNISINVVRRRRYIAPHMFEMPSTTDKQTHNWAAKPGYEDLVVKFLRNVVLINFTTSGMDLSQYGANKDTESMLESIHSYCDQYCTGFWTLDKEYSRDVDYDYNTHKNSYPGTGRGWLTVHFENEQDIDPFLKDCAITLKLAN